MAQRLAQHGYVAVTIEYRLSPEAHYPAAVHDTKAAIRWVRTHAAEYEVEPDKIALYGASSGGQIAALVGMTAGLSRFDGAECDSTISTAVQAVIDIDGVLDMTHPAESGKDTGSGPPSVGLRWFGASYKDRPDLWKEASPVNHVSKFSPPILFINSSQDRFHAGRDEMIARLNVFNIYTEVHTISDSPHQFWLFHPWSDQVFEWMTAFLDRTLKQDHR